MKTTTAITAPADFAFSGPIETRRRMLTAPLIMAAAAMVPAPFTYLIASGVHNTAFQLGLLAVLYTLTVVLLWLEFRQLRIGNSEIEERVRDIAHNYEAVINILNAALDLQDSVAFSQSRRVVELASVLAWQMGLRKEQVRLIEKAAILHDVGRIGVADELMGKPGPLNMSEQEEMKRHPEMGRRVLERITYLHDAAEIVYSHHERWDGQGYPRALRGEDIPLGARIFAVADAYNAITSRRPYRKPMPHRQAVDEIASNAGSQFDPMVVKAFQEAEQKGLIQSVDEHEGDEMFFAAVASRRYRRAVASPEI